MKRTQLLLFVILFCLTSGLQAAEVGFRGFWQNWVYYTPESAWNGGAFLRVFPTVKVNGAETFSMLVDFDTYDTRRSPNLDFKIYDFNISYIDAMLYNKGSNFRLEIGNLSSFYIPDVIYPEEGEEIKGISASDLMLGNVTVSSFVVWPRKYQYVYGTQINNRLGDTFFNTTFVSAPKYKMLNDKYLLEEPMLNDQVLVVEGSRLITPDAQIAGTLGFNNKDIGISLDQMGIMKKVTFDLWGISNSIISISLADYDPKFSPAYMSRRQIKYLNNIRDTKSGVFFFGTNDIPSLYKKQKFLDRSFIGQRGFQAKWSTVGLPLNIDFFSYDRIADRQSEELLETLTWQASTKISQKTLSAGYSVQNQLSPNQMFGFDVNNKNTLLNINLAYPKRTDNINSELRYGWWLLDATDVHIQAQALEWKLALIKGFLNGSKFSFGYEVQKGTKFLTTFSTSFDYRTTQGIGVKLGYRKTNPNYEKDFDRTLVLWRNIPSYGLDLDNYLYFHLETNI